MSAAVSTFNALAWVQAVSAELGAQWRAEASGIDEWNGRPNPERAYLNGADGVRLQVVGNGWRNEGRVSIRWDIAAELTEHARYGEDPHREITVSQEKTAKQAAGDIRRRLLPGLTAMIATLRASKHRKDAEAADRDGYYAAVSALLGGGVRDAFGRSSRPDVSFGSYDNGGELELFHDGTVQIKVRLPRERAELVVQAIAAARRPQGRDAVTVQSAALVRGEAPHQG